MPKIYFRRIISGALTLSEVPTLWHDDVQALLVDAGREDLCNE